MNDSSIRWQITRQFIQLLLGVLCVLLTPRVFAASDLHGYIMEVQLTPAICALDKNKAKQRKCLEGYSLTITGLIPETTKSDCSTRTSAELSPLQRKVVARVMPDEAARIRLWAGIGGCFPMTASQYFRTIINHADQLKVPDDLTRVETKKVQFTTIRSQFIKMNPKMPYEGIEFNCQMLKGKPVLTEIQICYKPNGQYRKCSSNVNSNCPHAFQIQGAY